MSSKLFVGNLSYSTGEAELRRAFEPMGALRSVSIITDRMTGRPRGFGFVEFERSDDAQQAIASLDGQQVDGRAISVNVARERERTPRFSNDGPPGGGGGGGYRGSSPGYGASGNGSSGNGSSGNGSSDYGSSGYGAQAAPNPGNGGYGQSDNGYGQGGGFGQQGGGGFGEEGEGSGQRPRRGGGKGSRGTNRW
jgi:RNA recognition motif-containing protein